MRKVKNILLIDDSEADNFIHKRVIEKSGVTENVTLKYSGLDAIEYLTTLVNKKYPAPEIIFLDINMPGMDGWGFLAEYDKLDEGLKGGIVICMLTTSVDERDENKAKELNLVRNFFNKPLNKELLTSIVEEFHSV